MGGEQLIHCYICDVCDIANSVSNVCFWLFKAGAQCSTANIVQILWTIISVCVTVSENHKANFF